MDLDDSESDASSAPSDGEDAGLDDSQSDVDLPSLDEIMAGGKTKGQGNSNSQDRLGKPEPRKDRRALIWGVSSDSEEMDLDDSESNASSAPSDDENEGLDDSQSTVDLPSIDKLAPGKDKSQDPSSQERHTRQESQAFCAPGEPTTCAITKVLEQASSAEDSETRQVPSPPDPDMPPDPPPAPLPCLDTRPPEEQATENEKDARATPEEVAAVPKCADTPYRGEGEGENGVCSHTPRPLEDASNSSEDELPPIPEEEDDDGDDEDYDPVQDNAVRRSPKRYRMPTPSSHGTSGEEDSESETETPLRPPKRRKVLPVSRLISVGSKNPSLHAKPSPKAKPTTRYPTSDDSSDTKGCADPQAKYEEWSLQNVILKRVTQDHGTVFQLQFAWDSCVGHDRQVHGSEHVDKGRKARRPPVKRTKFTPDEDALLIKLKRDGRLNWREIHRRFTEEFPGRSQGALQVRYCSKKKEK